MVGLWLLSLLCLANAAPEFQSTNSHEIGAPAEKKLFPGFPKSYQVFHPLSTKKSPVSGFVYVLYALCCNLQSLERQVGRSNQSSKVGAAKVRCSNMGRRRRRGRPQSQNREQQRTQQGHHLEGRNSLCLPLFVLPALKDVEYTVHPRIDELMCRERAPEHDHGNKRVRLF